MANLVVDNLIALRILYLLVTPFVKTKAYEYGIIDDKGNYLKKLKMSLLVDIFKKLG